MSCVRCGCTEARHCRGDGACIDHQHQCKAYLASWGASDVADFQAKKAAEVALTKTVDSK